MKSLALALVLSTLVLVACVTKQDLQDTRDQATKYLEIVNTRIAFLETWVAENQNHPDVALFEQELQGLRAGKDKADLVLVELDKTLTEWDNPSDPLGQLANTIVPFLPPGYRELGITVGALGGMFLRLRAWKNGAISIAQGFEDLKTDKGDSIMDSVIKTHGGTLRRTQTKTAKLAVDAAQGKKRVLI